MIHKTSLFLFLLAGVIVFTVDAGAQEVLVAPEPARLEAPKPAIPQMNVENIEVSPIPGFLAFRLRQEDLYWKSYLIHLPVTKIEQITSAPDETIMFISAFRFPGEADAGAVEFSIVDEIMSNDEVIQLVSQVMKSTIAQVPAAEPSTVIDPAASAAAETVTPIMAP
jgi:hypothetical protein